MLELFFPGVVPDARRSGSTIIRDAGVRPVSMSCPGLNLQSARSVGGHFPKARHHPIICAVTAFCRYFSLTAPVRQLTMGVWFANGFTS